MKRIDLSQNWKVADFSAEENAGIPSGAVDVSLPVDLLTRSERSFSQPAAAYNGGYAERTAVFYRSLPAVRRGSIVFLDLWGVNSVADVSLNGISLGTVSDTAHHAVALTSLYDYGGRNLLKLTVSAPAETGRYTGAGISGGAALLISECPVYLETQSLYVITDATDEKAHLRVSLTAGGCIPRSPRALTAEALIYNARGKRVARKVRKLRVSEKNKTFELPVRLSRFYEWSAADPYLYACTVNLYDGETLIDSDSVPFGIARVGLGGRGLCVNGKPVKLMGCVLSRDNGLLGNVSVPDAERYKLERIKALGYNAVRYAGLPSDAALDTLDKLGLMAAVDLFEVWAQGKFPDDGHRGFFANFLARAESEVKTLRRHPCVVLYSLGAELPECYDRDDGAATAMLLAARVRQLDDSRPVTAGASELVPLRREIEAAGGKASKLDGAQAAVNFGREKNLFRTLTADFFRQLDVAGYCYLYPRYASDRAVSDQPAVGLATLPCRAFDAWEETEKLPHVLGDFKMSGADFVGYPIGRPVCPDAPVPPVPPHVSYCGDLDLTYERKAQSYYREILAGHRNVSLITVEDPDSKQTCSGSDFSVPDARSVWNWPRHLGQPVEIRVFTGGEVVALYLNGKLIGRKLAGKVNRHIASFRTEYYPGKLEAVSYHRGAECSRAVLESVTAPRAFKLETDEKTVRAGQLCYVRISVTDKEGRTVPYASREVEVSVTGEGERVALGNGDPACGTKPTGESCPVFNGRALLIVRAGAEGKITVKATGDGLLCARAVLRVKPAL